MINLEKWKSTPLPPPRPPTLLRRPSSAPYFHPLFKIFRSPLSKGGNQNLLSPLILKREGVGVGVGVQTMVVHY